MGLALGERRHHVALAGVLVTAAAAIALLLAGPGAQKAYAASCTITPYHQFGGGVLVLGASQCGTSKELSRERFEVNCQGGTAHSVFQFEDETGPYPPVEFFDGPCSAVSFVSVSGLGGIDIIDLHAVGLAAGFTGTAALDGGDGADQLFGSTLPDEVRGGSGPDVIAERDGVADTVDCGDGFDAVQADRASLDSLSNCEVADFLPEPAPAVVFTTPATPTAQTTPLPVRKKKCKKPTRSSASASKKCKRR
jgi:hypothetical protein